MIVLLSTLIHFIWNIRLIFLLSLVHTLWGEAGCLYVSWNNKKTSSLVFDIEVCCQMVISCTCMVVWHLERKHLPFSILEKPDTLTHILDTVNVPAVCSRVVTLTTPGCHSVPIYERSLCCVLKHIMNPEACNGKWRLLTWIGYCNRLNKRWPRGPKVLGPSSALTCKMSQTQICQEETQNDHKEI